MTGGPLVFVDLDDTLFCSRRKTPDAGAEPIAYRSDGVALSFMTARQSAFFEWLSRDAVIVPTTGRNAAALGRVRLRFVAHAICSFGGLLLCPDGSPEPRWRAYIEEQARAALPRLGTLLEMIRMEAARVGVDVRARSVADDGLELYLSIKHNADDAAALAALVPFIESHLPEGWRIGLNDNNLAVLPAFLGKEKAVAWYLEHLAAPHAFVLGAGDSFSDAPFLALCDYVLTPAQSQLFRQLLEATR
jgi:hydroxymethylpyrimidine pyrophosphatase-like HAD family hydrolase